MKLRPIACQALLALLLSLGGCNAILGIDEPEKRRVGTGSDGGPRPDAAVTPGLREAGPGADTGTSMDAASQGDAAPKDAAPPGEAPCDPNETPAADGVFVSPAGSDENAGSPQLPLATVEAAVARAKAKLVTRIYLERGTYNLAQTLTFTAAESGLILDGGFRREGPTWRPDCVANRRAYTILSVASPVAVRVQGTTTAAALRHMTLATKATGASPAAMPGESLYGVWASGAGTVFNLTDVHVIVGDAGSGGAPPAAPATTGTAACSGHTGCCTSGAGCGDNATGPVEPAQAQAGPMAGTSGIFDEDGYLPQDGSTGNAGTRGTHGREGVAGVNKGNVCRVGGSCGSCQPSCPGTCLGGSSPSGYSLLQGERGRCGCGGEGGTGGAGGRGGGASVGLFVTAGATVSVQFSSLQAGRGGDGQVGGPGGQGGPGAPGVQGAPAGCNTSCYTECFGSCGCAIFEDAAGGAAGTRGGVGGDGGGGGGGAGGPSYAVVTLGDGVFSDAGDNALMHGLGGKGADGAVDGAAGPRP